VMLNPYADSTPSTLTGAMLPTFHMFDAPFVEDTNKVERTWMNTHLVHEGALPILNKAYSPIFS